VINVETEEHKNIINQAIKNDQSFHLKAMSQHYQKISENIIKNKHTRCIWESSQTQPHFTLNDKFWNIRKYGNC